jgi:tetratricopeptide (TPR) repeat protein
MVMALLFTFINLKAQDMSTGLRLLDVEKYEEAGKFFQTRTTTDPLNSVAYYLAGEAAIRSGKLNDAKQIFTKGIGAVNNSLMNAATGVWMGENGDADGARKFYTSAVTMAEKEKDMQVLLYTARALSSFEVKHLEGALSLVNRVIAADKKGTNAEAHFLLGCIYLDMGEGGKAVSSFEKTAEIDKATAKPFWMLGYLYTRSRNTREALPNFEKALALDAALAPVYRDMGDLYFQMNQTTKAIESYKKYLSMIDKSVDAQIKYASFLVTNKDYANAYTESKAIEQVGTDNVYLYRMLAYAACEIDSVKEGLAAMEKFLAQVAPAKIRVGDYEYLGKLNLKAGQDAKAYAAFRQAIDMDSTKAAELHGYAADYFYKSKNFAKAAVAYDSLFLYKTNGILADLFNQGRAYYNTKQYGKADTSFSKLIEGSPSYIPAYIYRGRCNQSFEKRPDEGKAKPYFEKVIELATDPVKYKRDLIEANRYMGFHYYYKNDKAMAKQYLNKVLELDPNDKDVKIAVANLK